MKALFISQPSLSNAIKEIEKEARLTIFTRSRQGIALTKEGSRFLGYARNVVQQMELLEDKYITSVSEKIRFTVSTQHYTFTSNAFTPGPGNILALNAVNSYGWKKGKSLFFGIFAGVLRR